MRDGLALVPLKRLKFQIPVCRLDSSRRTGVESLGLISGGKFCCLLLILSMMVCKERQDREAQLPRDFEAC